MVVSSLWMQAGWVLSAGKAERPGSVFPRRFPERFPDRGKLPAADPMDLFSSGRMLRAFIRRLFILLCRVRGRFFRLPENFPGPDQTKKRSPAEHAERKGHFCPVSFSFALPDP